MKKEYKKPNIDKLEVENIGIICASIAPSGTESEKPWESF